MLRRVVVLISSLFVIVAAAPAAAGGGGCHGPQTDGEGTTVQMSALCFSPTVVRVAEGDTVTWENMDSVDHNVYSSAMEGYGTATLQGGDSASITFDEAGVFPYVCTFHPGMVGAVVVGDADTSPPAVDAVAPVVAAEAPSSDDARLAERIDQLEAAVLLGPVPTEESSWPPMVIGLITGLAVGALVLRGRPT